MSSPYPEEGPRLNVISHLEELRKRILYSLLFLSVFAVLAFLKGDLLMHLMTRPIAGYIDDFVFISPTEAFVSYVKVAILAGFFTAFPIVTYQIWAFLSPAFPGDRKKRIAVWLSCGFILFYFGILFSYTLAIPAALKFLVSFGSGIARANISIGKYVSFVSALLLVGGIIFEIPILIGLASDVGLVKTQFLKRKRHYAVLAIMIFAAIITPTQDILNMLLFAIPMILLYELGIIIASIIERKK